MLKGFNLFEYMDYRELLRDAYVHMKRHSKKFSYRYFAQQAGVGSPSYLKLVMDGQRNLSADMARSFARALGLNKQESKFFVNLVLMNQAKTTEDRAYYYEEITQIPKYRQTHKLERIHYDYYSRWYCVPIRELVAHQDFREDPTWIAKQLRPAISDKQAAEALDLLLALGMIERNKKGKLVQTESLLSTGPELRSLMLRRFHSKMLHLADAALDGCPMPEREVGGVTLRLTASQVDQLKERLYAFRQEILQMEGMDAGDEAIHHFSFQLFPLSHFSKRGIA